MKIGILGELTRFEELKQTLPTNATLIYDEKHLPEPLDAFDFVFDLSFDHPTISNDLSFLSSPGTVFFLSAASIELKSVQSDLPLSNNVFGMNCLPTFINRSVKEISYHSEEQLSHIADLEQRLNWKIAPVKDRVGMITPRILFMIINEAYFTLQEGTASREAIDTGMELGTNYPFGPLEWCEKIGTKTVVTMLQRLYDDTKDERYKVCSMLKTAAY